MRFLKPILFILFILFSTIKTNAQVNEIKYLHSINLKVKDGLPNNNINFIFQDYKNFIWIGTYNGLSRFDGYVFNNIFIKAKSEENSINHFKTFCKINDSIYWVSTHLEGIFELNINNLNLKKINNSPAIANFIYKSKNGIYWIGTLASGLYSYNSKSKKFKQYLISKIEKDFKYNLQNNTVNEIVQDPKNDSLLWLSCRSGLKSFNVFNNKIENYNLSHSDASHQIALNHSTSLKLVDSNLWVGRFFGGLGNFDLKTKTWKTYFYNPQNFEQDVLSDNTILKIYNTEKNMLWLATSAGVFVFDIKTEKFIKYSLINSYNDKISGVTSILTDKTGNKWFGHIDKSGISMASPKLNSSVKIELPMQFFKPDYYNSVVSDIIYSKKYKRYFASVTNHDGLLEYSIDFKLLKQKTIPSNWLGYEPMPLELAEDDNGIVWILDITESLIKYNPVSGTFINLKTDLFSKCTSIQNDLNGNTYFVTDKGLFSLKNNIWHKLLNTTENIIISNIRNNKIFIIQDRKLKVFDIETKKTNSIIELPEFSTKNNNYIQSIYCDRKNRLWIPLELGGVYIYEIQKKQLKTFTGFDGLNSNTARETIEDANGRIFLLCNGGLYFFNENQQRFIDLNNLINSKNKWFEHFINISTNNKLLLSTENSIDIVDQSKILEFKNNLPVITSISAHNFEYYSFNETITIPEFINNIKISFSNFDFASSKEIIYQYKLNNSKNWITLEKGKNSVYLLGLSEGKHTFKLKLYGHKNFTSTNFVIKLIWYRSKLFYVFIIITFISILIFIIWNFQKRKITEESLHKKIAQYKLIAIQKQLNPHFLFNSLNSINALIKLGEYQKSEETIQSFAKLMRQILSVSDEQLITLKQEMELNELYLEIEKLRKNYTFDYNITSQIENLSKIKVPPLLLQPFLENCVKHGFKTTSNNSKFLIEIILNQTGKKTTIEIIDNGSGSDINSNPSHISRGIQLQIDRLKQYKITHNLNIEIENGNIEPKGYRVLINIF